jgi:HlyD family secretion protein
MVVQLDQLRRLQITRPESGNSKPSRYSKKFWLAITTIAILAVLAVVWHRLSAPAAVEVEAARATAETQDTSGLVLSASGYIVAHHRIDVNSKVTGRVAWIGVEKGDAVKEGQVLVRLEDQEFQAQVEQSKGEAAAAKARLDALLAGARPEEIQRELNNLHEAEAVFENDRSLLKRNEDLFAAGVISKQQFEDAKARYHASEQHVASLRQTYTLASKGPRKEDIDKAKGDYEQALGKVAFSVSQLEATRIRAPLSGTILERTAEKGELVTAQFASAADTGGPRGSVVALADLNDLQVETDISQDDFAKLRGVTKAVVTTDAYPDKQYEGSVAQIAPEANRQKGTMQVRIQIVRPDNFLRPEMNANVAFFSANKSISTVAAVEVPFSSVITRDQKRAVFLIIDDKAVQRGVKIIGKKTTGYLIEGIQDGDRIVVDPPGALKDRDRIRVVTH